MNRVSIIIPCYNEEESIGGVLQDIKDLGKDYEIIVVDDGSTDNTQDILVGVKGVEVIRHPYNKGYGAALKTGIRKAKSNIILTMDSDGQHAPEDILKLLDNIDGFDMVTGIRKNATFSLFRKPAKKLLNLIGGFLVGKCIPDINCGFRVFKKDKVLEFMSIIPNGFSFTVTTLLAFLKSAYDVKYVPIGCKKRIGRTSNVEFFKDGLQTLLLIVRVIVLFNPLKIFVPISIFLFTIGTIYALTYIILIFHIPTGASLLILSSFIIFSFGILADQISAIRRGRE